MARLVGKRDEPIQTYPGRDGGVVSSPEIGEKTAQCFLPNPDLQYGQGYVGELEWEALIRKLNSENTDYAT